jgi:hypothetical protein
LLSVAPYCVPGGIRVVSKMLLFLVVCGDLGVTQSTILHLAQIVHRHADPITAPQPAESVIRA